MVREKKADGVKKTDSVKKPPPDSRYYEITPSAEQNLTFFYARKLFADQNVDLSGDALISLGLAAPARAAATPAPPIRLSPVAIRIPAPAPVYAPVPVSAPASLSAPVPSPAAAPEPALASVPEPVSIFVPVPAPTPAPVPATASVPAPASAAGEGGGPHDLPEGYIYTNAALLVSDQCGNEIQCTVFREKDEPRSGFRKKFTGSILKQYAESLQYANANSAAFDKRRRAHGNPDGFIGALNDFLLNAIIHREYPSDSRIQINVYDGRVDVISPGGLAKGVTIKDILSGEAEFRGARNKVLAGVFERLGLYSGGGNAIRRIMSEYSDCLVSPVFRHTQTSFTASLPKMIGGISPMRGHSRLKEELILKTIAQKGSITRMDVEQILKSSRNTAITLLDGLIDEGKIVKIGSARSVRYILPQ